MVKHGVGQKRECDICKKEFLRLSTFREHRKTHDDGGRLRCSVCGDFFAQNNDLEKHARLNHAGVAVPLDH